MINRRRLCQSPAALGVMAGTGLAGRKKKQPSPCHRPAPPRPAHGPECPHPAIGPLTSRNCDRYTTQPYFQRRWKTGSRKRAFHGSTPRIGRPKPFASNS